MRQAPEQWSQVPLERAFRHNLLPRPLGRPHGTKPSRCGASPTSGAWSPYDAINGIAAGDGRIKAWGRGVEGLECKKVLEGHRDVSFNAVVLTQDGGGSDGSMSLRHMVIEGHHGPVKCLQASPVRVGGGFMLYSGSLDRSIRVWWVPASSYAHHSN
ncbi:hypothetical protein SASPL_118378 [Salvia splendens]|uniref:Uncharacterized protein n=1 Tax=Salvia splendens TaxID=180675 RepID=A0A8X8XWM6_SALSN|nr:hypothetical protein SASPL_118378 [Salvia splendens]